MDNNPNFSRETKLEWAGSRDGNLGLRSGWSFSLTSLFTELIDRIVNAR
jgi:hypothetical protein